jgi:uncharacterized protein YjbI with pentapeptide repeats
MNAKQHESGATSAEEILRRYQSGERNFEGSDLPDESCLRGASLAGANFSRSWLSWVDFRGADLRGVCFDQCNVKVSDFRGADLTGASFREAMLCGALFDRSTKLDDVAVVGAEFYGSQVDDIRTLVDDKKP